MQNWKVQGPESLQRWRNEEEAMFSIETADSAKYRPKTSHQRTIHKTRTGCVPQTPQKQQYKWTEARRVLIADPDKADCDMLPKVQWGAAYPMNYDNIHSIVTSLRDVLHFSISLPVPINSISDMNEYPAWLNDELKRLIIVLQIFLAIRAMQQYSIDRVNALNAALSLHRPMSMKLIAAPMMVFMVAQAVN
uniref:Uncharacterized protein n=1 Tax=Glossina pallidipes TaxID=7398 RepID=A0A1B0ADI2_GLOPL